jgi:hypothetical protein
MIPIRSDSHKCDTDLNIVVVVVVVDGDEERKP